LERIDALVGRVRTAAEKSGGRTCCHLCRLRSWDLQR
jgi:hypothetical protein